MNSTKRVLIAGLLGTAIALPTIAHIEKAEPIQSIRQSYFALIGMTFSPMGDMLKGKIDWDQETFAGWANDLASVSSYGVERGFAPGSEEGKTRAKPDIWLDMDDFNERLQAFRTEASKLATVAQTGDRQAIAQQFGATGKTCKGCHDSYKAKDYLYE